MMNFLKTLTLFLILGLGAASASADHLPPSKLVNGAPEHLLAGVNIYDDKMPKLLKRFGKPDKFEESTNADYPKGSGERTYVWIRNGIKMRISTEFFTDPNSKTITESAPMIVDVWGVKRDGQIGQTGRGLSIGDLAVKVRGVYGNRFQSDPKGMTLQWKDETTLVIELNRMGRVIHMQLIAATE